MISDLDVPTIMEGLYQIHGLEDPKDYQEEILRKWTNDLIISEIDREEFIRLKRRTGKTTYLAIKAIAHAIRGELVEIQVPRSSWKTNMIGKINAYCTNPSIRELITVVPISDARYLRGTTPQWILIDDH